MKDRGWATLMDNLENPEWYGTPNPEWYATVKEEVDMPKTLKYGSIDDLMAEVHKLASDDKIVGKERVDAYRLLWEMGKYRARMGAETPQSG